MDNIQNLSATAPESNGIPNNAAITASNETAAELVAALLPQSWGRQIPTGYHPFKVTHSFQNAPLFRAWLNALPADLTGIDLSPVYLLAGDAGEAADLLKRELSWEPNPDNLGDEYNGPIGEEGRPHHRNAVKWARAVEKKEREHKERFDADLRLMKKGEIPLRLRDAAMDLIGLAQNPGIRGEGEDAISEWDESAQAFDIIATAAAIRLCLAALCDIEARAQETAQASLAYYRNEVSSIERLSRASAKAIEKAQGVLS